MALDESTIRSLRVVVLTWYDLQRRSFAFRGIRDPYGILVSEVILQQTQASRGEPAWRAFMARFPTVESLAEATPADVLRQWQGLGYNRRALNLHRAARAIVEHHGGTVPDDLAALEALPGIGPYTARAVAAVAFERPVGAVDTNVRRVLGRVVAGHGNLMDHGQAMTARDLQALADALVPAERPGDWTAALMDIGAAICRPRRPDCASCPLSGECRYVAGTGRTSVGEQAPRAAHVPRPRTTEAPIPYEATGRWLRGRIVDRLRALPAGGSMAIEAPIGGRGPADVSSALAALTRDGLIEPDGAGGWRLPD